MCVRVGCVNVLRGCVCYVCVHAAVCVRDSSELYNAIVQSDNHVQCLAYKTNASSSIVSLSLGSRPTYPPLISPSLSHRDTHTHTRDSDTHIVRIASCHYKCFTIDTIP